MFDPSRTTDRLVELSDDVAALLRDALAVTVSGDGATPDAWVEQSLAFTRALEAAGFSCNPEGSDPRRALVDVARLTSEQRVVAEILAYVEQQPLDEFPLPATAWVRRQWLGLDPPGPLFAITLAGHPAYHALRTADDETAHALLASLPVAQRIAVCADIMLATSDFALDVEALLAGDLATIGGDAGDWAGHFADRLLALFAPGRTRSERGNFTAVPLVLRRAVVVALVRAGLPLEPRWDTLLPLAAAVPINDQLASIDAIAPDRRDVAITTALRRVASADERLQQGLVLLPHHPSPALVRAIAASLLDASAPGRARAELVQRLQELHELAPLLDEPGLIPAPPRLVVASMRTPITEDTLDDAGRAQLAWIDEQWGQGGVDRALTLVARVTRDDQDAYDLWLTMADTGVVFSAGTTDVVAQIVQGDVECRDGLFRMALGDLVEPLWQALRR